MSVGLPDPNAIRKILDELHREAELLANKVRGDDARKLLAIVSSLISVLREQRHPSKPAVSFSDIIARRGDSQSCTDAHS